ncbi:hypothetical protein FRC07_009695 [Ceratobasidium sp. 392]|nr:hypothetical protein FRC07_009695 [Ceratobasidium sp. 392]
MSSQRRDFRRMLYRLDLATPYLSIPALIQHFMDETPLDGVVEVKMVASPPMSAPTTSRGKRSTKPPPPPLPPLQPTTSVISFRREGREVNAIALYGPASAPSSVIAPDEGGGSYRSIDAVLAGYDRPGMVVKKRYPPRTTLVWVFAPLVQKLLDEGADTVLFEVRSYIAGADSVRESGPSPVSPYGTSHSTTAPSPSVFASESTPSSGGVGSAFGDRSASQYAPSPSHPVAETEAPILTELHRRPRDLRAEATSYEAPRQQHLRSPVQRHASMPMPFPSNAPSTFWSHSQSNQWAIASGYHDLQSLPPPPAWDSSFNSEGWSEHAHPSWQPAPTSEPYAYPAIPPLPWQSLQDPAYAPSTLDPVLSQPYIESLTPQSFNETYYTPDTSFSAQAEFSASPQGIAESHASGVPATFQGSSGMSSGPVQEAANWQAQYPYLGALDIPPVGAFSYSPAPRRHSGGREAGIIELNRPPDAGSPDSPPPPSSDRDSLTPTLTNPGYDRAPTTTPRQQWPFARGPPNQSMQPVSSAYTPQSHTLGTPGPSTFRSFSETIPRPRIRLRSGSPEHTPESPQRGAKRLKVSAGNTPGSRIISLASPPPLSAGSSSSQPRSIKSRVSSTIASGSGAQRSLHAVSPADQSPAQDQQELDNALLEILTRPAPYKRMLGYAARQQDGSTVAYELSDSVAATTGGDTLLGLGLSNVTDVAALGMELGRRAARRQNESAGSSQGIVEPSPSPNANVYGEHGNPRQPRGGEGWRSHIRGASGRSSWQGCVVA